MKLLYFLVLGVSLTNAAIQPTTPEFSEYTVPDPLKLEGPLSLNTKLNNAELLFLNKVQGPESLGIYKGELYVSSMGGFIYKISNGKLVQVAKTGVSCASEAVIEQKKCGHPLGLKIDETNGVLYFADSYFGIHKVDLNTGKLTRLVSSEEPINGTWPMSPNAVELAKDGSIYWTDTSSTYHFEDGLFIMLAAGSGRLFKYNPQTNKNEVLLDKAHFANGIALADDESYIVMAETIRSRIIKYYLKGDKAGTSEVLIEGLPGLPDNIRKNSKGEFVVGLVKPEGTKTLEVKRLLGSHPSLAWLGTKVMASMESFFRTMNSIIPNSFAQQAIHTIGSFGSVDFLFDKRVTVITFTGDGKITGSFHATDGKIGTISDMIEFNGYYYLGSPYNPYLARVKIE